MRHPSRTISLAATAMGVVAVLASPIATPAAPAVAAASVDEAFPRSDDPRVLFVEDFEHGVSTTPIMLNDYVSADGGKYTADPAWIDAAQCNGIVISASSSDMAACASNDKLKALGSALGQITGEDELTNHVVSAWTESRNLPADAVQIEALQDFSLGATGRFVSFGVSAAAGACVGFAHPLLDFLLVDGDVERPVSERALNPCTDPRSKSYTADGQTFKGGEYVSSGGVLFSGDTLRWRLRNAQTSSSGNDAAVDRVTIVDSTPRLSNEFSGRPIVGDTARMTVRVVNTSENGAKPGWSFSERLPEGLTVAEDPKLETTCSNVDTKVPAGGSEISVKGDLAIDAADCSTSFDVIATAPGTYTVDASNVSSTRGLDLPTAATVEFTPERNELSVSEEGSISGGNGDEFADLGEQVAFTAVVENRGNVGVTKLTAAGDRGEVRCDDQQLAPGDSTVCRTSPRPVTQDDIDAGSIADRVTAEAVSRLGVPVADSATASVPTTPVTAAASLHLAARAAGAPGVGDDVRLTSTVHNTGNVSLRDLSVAVDGDGFEAVCPTASLAPGASIECDVTGKHTVTQADVDEGSVQFHAELQAVDAAGNPVSDETSTEQETVAQAPVISATALPELRSEGGAPVAGDVVALIVRATNAGNVTLHDVAGAITGREGLDVACPVDVLGPGESTDCTVPDYRLTQEDVDNGEVGFEASVSAVGPKDQPVDSSDTARVTVDRKHGIVATATAQLANSGEVPKAGDRVELSVLAHNSGNTTLHGFTAELGDEDLDVECADRSVAPGGDLTCSVSDHVLTQAEVDAGTVGFDVEVTAHAPGGQRPNAKDSVSVELARVPSVDMTATSVLDPSEHEVPLAGDTATVAMTISNTGNVTVTGVRGAVADREGLDVACPEDSLAPGQRVTCKVSGYALTQGDIDHGQVQFDVEATATGANRERVTAHAGTTLTIVRAPAIQTSAVSTLDSTDREHTAAGDTATVRLTIENAGNVTVRDLAGAVIGRDDMVASCSKEALAPGKSADCTLSKYTLVQDDVDAGKVGFEISGSATGANDQTVTANASTGFDIERLPSVVTEVVAHLAPSDHDTPRAGDRIEVGVHATNSGNVTLTHARAEIVELADLPVTCPAVGFAPGATLECAVPDYVLTQADIDHGRVSVSAVLDAVGPGGSVVTDRDEVRVGLTAKSALDLSAEAVTRDGAGALRVLEEGRSLRPGNNVLVQYTIVNTGNLVIDDVQQAADLPELSVEQTRLLPGERTSALTTAAHTVTDAEAAAGTVVLVGQVQGSVSRADGESIEDSGAATIGQTAGIESSERAEQADPGAEPRRVLSNQVEITIPTERAPIELAFTGSEVTQIVLPAGLVLLLAGCVLLLWVKRRRRESTDERNG